MWGVLKNAAAIGLSKVDELTISATQILEQLDAAVDGDGDNGEDDDEDDEDIDNEDEGVEGGDDDIDEDGESDNDSKINEILTESDSPVLRMPLQRLRIDSWDDEEDDAAPSPHLMSPTKSPIARVINVSRDDERKTLPQISETDPANIKVVKAVTSIHEDKLISADIPKDQSNDVYISCRNCLALSEQLLEARVNIAAEIEAKSELSIERNELIQKVEALMESELKILEQAKVEALSLSVSRANDSERKKLQSEVSNLNAQVEEMAQHISQNELQRVQLLAQVETLTATNNEAIAQLSAAVDEREAVEARLAAAVSKEVQREADYALLLEECDEKSAKFSRIEAERKVEIKAIQETNDAAHQALSAQLIEVTVERDKLLHEHTILHACNTDLLARLEMQPQSPNEVQFEDGLSPKATRPSTISDDAASATSATGTAEETVRLQLLLEESVASQRDLEDMLRSARSKVRSVEIVLSCRSVFALKSSENVKANLVV